MIDVKKITSIIGSTLLVASLGACSGLFVKPKTEAELKAEAGTLLILKERESGSPEFTSRIFVNEGYLHMSDARSPADFVLFNRKEQTIYNVNQEDKTIMVIRNKPVNIEPPIALDYQEESQPSGAIPKIDGREATHYRYMANGKHCYDAVTLPKDFMPDVTAALREFRQVLAGEHATTVNAIPRDLLDACDLSVNIFHATKHMDNGLPIREWDRQGFQRFMKDYRTGIVPGKGTLDLPKDFERYSVGDILVKQPAGESAMKPEVKSAQ